MILAECSISTLLGTINVQPQDPLGILAHH